MTSIGWCCAQGSPYISTGLERYFPRVLRERFREQIWRHPLKREIGATHVTNSMVNRVGSTFVHPMQEQTGAPPPEMVPGMQSASADLSMLSVALRELRHLAH